MTHRHHLIIDGLGQAILIIFYGLLLGKSQSADELLLLFPIVLTAWQFVNGVLSYKFFERDSKKTYVRIGGTVLIVFSVFWGLLWMLQNIAQINIFINNFADGFLPVFWVLLPIICGALAIWYIYITIKDLYNMMYNTI
jgi:hypothetical protein